MVETKFLVRLRTILNQNYCLIKDWTNFDDRLEGMSSGHCMMGNYSSKFSTELIPIIAIVLSFWYSDCIYSALTLHIYIASGFVFKISKPLLRFAIWRMLINLFYSYVLLLRCKHVSYITEHIFFSSRKHKFLIFSKLINYCLFWK